MALARECGSGDDTLCGAARAAQQRLETHVFFRIRSWLAQSLLLDRLKEAPDLAGLRQMAHVPMQIRPRPPRPVSCICAVRAQKQRREGKGPCLTDAAHFTLSRRPVRVFAAMRWSEGAPSHSAASLRRWCHPKPPWLVICRQWRQVAMLLRSRRAVKPDRGAMVDNRCVPKVPVGGKTGHLRRLGEGVDDAGAVH